MLPKIENTYHATTFRTGENATFSFRKFAAKRANKSFFEMLQTLQVDVLKFFALVFSFNNLHDCIYFDFTKNK